MSKLTVTLIPVAEVNQGVRAHVNVAEAAAKIGCSEATIRRAAKRAGVKRIAGRVVAGGILIDTNPVPMVIVYAD